MFYFGRKLGKLANRDGRQRCWQECICHQDCNSHAPYVVQVLLHAIWPQKRHCIVPSSNGRYTDIRLVDIAPFFTSMTLSHSQKCQNSTCKTLMKYYPCYVMQTQQSNWRSSLSSAIPSTILVMWLPLGNFKWRRRPLKRSSYYNIPQLSQNYARFWVCATCTVSLYQILPCWHPT